MNTVDIVVPCYNEAENLPRLFEEYESLIEKNSTYQFNLILVDNGSTDDTLTLALNFIETRKNVVCLELSRNFGKEASLTAGLGFSKSQIVIPMDADLQDPMSIVPILLMKWDESGADVVLGRRKSRSEDTLFRRGFSKLYGTIFRNLSSVNLEPNVGEFRLMTRRVVDAFNQMPERERFVRGMLAWLGFRIEIIDYERPARLGGTSSFNIFRLVELGVQGITAFSTKPLRVATILGGFLSICTGAYALYIFWLAIGNKTGIPGYASILLTVLFLGSIQIVFLGFLGEYLGRVLLESKHRPNYVIREVYTNNAK